MPSRPRPAGIHSSVASPPYRAAGSRSIAVIGAGVVGLTCALELARAGHLVTIVADASAEDSVSGVAGGIWFPHQSEGSPRAARLLLDSFAAFRALAHSTPEAGVDLRRGLWVGRGAASDDSWVDSLGAMEEGGPAGRAALTHLPKDQLPAGATQAFTCSLPVVDMPTYLPWLRTQCAAAGVRTLSATADSVAHAAAAAVRDGNPADLVLVAAGERSGELLGDASGYPVRGQVVRLEQPLDTRGAPSITEWFMDDDHPDGMIYVIPRRADIVVGGTDDVGATDTTWNESTEAAILSRAALAVPALAGLRVHSRGVGVRPARPSLRLEAVAGHPVQVIAAYGFGGAGVTLSWGAAAEAVALAKG